MLGIPPGPLAPKKEPFALNPLQQGLLGLAGGLLTRTPTYGAFNPGPGIMQGLGQYQQALNFELLKKKQKEEEEYRRRLLGIREGELDLKRDAAEMEAKGWDIYRNLFNPQQQTVGIDYGLGTTPSTGLRAGGGTGMSVPHAQPPVSPTYGSPQDQMSSFVPGTVAGPQFGSFGSIPRLGLNPGMNAGMEAQQIPAEPQYPAFQQQGLQSPDLTNPFVPQTLIGRAQRGISADEMFMAGMRPGKAGEAMRDFAKFMRENDQWSREFTRGNLQVDELTGDVFNKATSEWYEPGKGVITAEQHRRNREQIAKAGATRVNQTLSQGVPFGKTVQEKVAGNFGDLQPAAEDAVQVINTIHEGRRILDEGAITGFGANFLTGFGKALLRVGIDFGLGDTVANTEAYGATMAENVGKLIKQFGSGTGLSDADREYAQKMAAGEISMTEKSLRKILDIKEKQSRWIINKYNEKASAIDASEIGAGIPYKLEIDMPPEYSKGESSSVDTWGVERE